MKQAFHKHVGWDGVLVMVLASTFMGCAVYFLR